MCSLFYNLAWCLNRSRNSNMCWMNKWVKEVLEVKKASNTENEKHKVRELLLDGLFPPCTSVRVICWRRGKKTTGEWLKIQSLSQMRREVTSVQRSLARADDSAETGNHAWAITAPGPPQDLSYFIGNRYWLDRECKQTGRRLQLGRKWRQPLTKVLSDLRTAVMGENKAAERMKSCGQRVAC